MSGVYRNEGCGDNVVLALKAVCGHLCYEDGSKVGVRVYRSGRCAACLGKMKSPMRMPTFLCRACEIRRERN